MSRLELALTWPLLLIGCGETAWTGETLLVAIGFEKAAEGCNASVRAGSSFDSAPHCLEMLNNERGYRAFRADMIDRTVSGAQAAAVNETAARAYRLGADAMQRAGVRNRELLDRFSGAVR